MYNGELSSAGLVSLSETGVGEVRSVFILSREVERGGGLKV